MTSLEKELAEIEGRTKARLDYLRDKELLSDIPRLIEIVRMLRTQSVRHSFDNGPESLKKTSAEIEALSK